MSVIQLKFNSKLGNFIDMATSRSTLQTVKFVLNVLVVALARLQVYARLQDQTNIEDILLAKKNQRS